MATVLFLPSLSAQCILLAFLAQTFFIGCQELNTRTKRVELISALIKDDKTLQRPIPTVRKRYFFDGAQKRLTKKESKLNVRTKRIDHKEDEVFQKKETMKKGKISKRLLDKYDALKIFNSFTSSRIDKKTHVRVKKTEPPLPSATKLYPTNSLDLTATSVQQTTLSPKENIRLTTASSSTIIHNPELPTISANTKRLSDLTKWPKLKDNKTVFVKTETVSETKEYDLLEFSTTPNPTTQDIITTETPDDVKRTQQNDVYSMSENKVSSSPTPNVENPYIFEKTANEKDKANVNDINHIQQALFGYCSGRKIRQTFTATSVGCENVTIDTLICGGICQPAIQDFTDLEDIEEAFGTCKFCGPLEYEEKLIFLQCYKGYEKRRRWRLEVRKIYVPKTCGCIKESCYKLNKVNDEADWNR